MGIFLHYKINKGGYRGYPWPIIAFVKNMFISCIGQKVLLATNGTGTHNRVPSSKTSTVTYPKFDAFVCRMTQS